MSILSLSFADYLAHPSYGSGDMRTYRIGPPSMVDWRRRHPDETDTDATRLGRAAHCRVLTPALYARTFIAKPAGMTFASREGKAWRDVHAGLDILSATDAIAVAGVADAIAHKAAAHDTIMAARGAGTIETSVFWVCTTGLLCKGRPDWYLPAAVYDLKVSRVADSPPIVMARKCYWNGWLHQLAHYRAGLVANGVPVKRGRLVIVSPTPPHCVHLLDVSEADMDYLDLENLDVRNKMRHHCLTGEWPGTPDQWRTIELPAIGTETDMTGADTPEEHPNDHE
jgi:hypothetical protein